MARQRQLERAGWAFVRIRESEFYADRDGALRRILEACDQLGIRPVGEEEREMHEEAATTVSVREAWPPEDEEHGRRCEADEEVLETGKADLRPSPSTEYLEEPSFPDPRDAPLANVRAVLRQIIEREGPLTKRLLFRLYVEGCPTLHRAGKTVRSILNRALYSMQKAGELAVEDELGDRSLESQVLRLASGPRVRERPAGRRDLLDIPPSELLLVIDRMRTSSTSSAQDDEDLARALLAHYGFTRLTEARRKHIVRILDVYRQHNRESKSGGAA